MLHLEAASLASRPASKAPTESGTVEKNESEEEDVEGGFSEWLTATMSDSLTVRQAPEYNRYCDADDAPPDDMDDLYGYCDCIGWDGSKQL
jgi:hypothetical protein